VALPHGQGAEGLRQASLSSQPGAMGQRVAIVAALWVAGSLVVAISTFWWEAVQIGQLGGMNMLYLLPALALAFVSFGLRTLRWHLFLAAVGAHPPFLASFRAQLMGFSLAMTPGKVGEVYKCYVVEQSTGTPTARTAPIVFFEKLMDAIAFSALAVVAAALLPGIAASVEAVSRSLMLVILAGVLVAIVLRTVRPESATRVLNRVLGRHPLGRKLAKLMIMALDGGAELLRPVTLIRNMALSLIARTCDGLTLMWCALALGINLPALAGIFALNSSGAVGGLSMLPGGIGVVEGAMTALLTTFGASLAAAFAATMAARFLTFWLWVGIGLAMLLRAGFLSRQPEAE
jgi:glycosyltransferase 2 family protein